MTNLVNVRKFFIRMWSGSFETKKRTPKYLLISINEYYSDVLGNSTMRCFKSAEFRTKKEASYYLANCVPKVSRKYWILYKETT